MALSISDIRVIHKLSTSYQQVINALWVAEMADVARGSPKKSSSYPQFWPPLLLLYIYNIIITEALTLVFTFEFNPQMGLIFTFLVFALSWRIWNKNGSLRKGNLG
jgi:hypothetical protein